MKKDSNNHVMKKDHPVLINNSLSFSYSAASSGPKLGIILTKTCKYKT
jgi:hypothetical protein